MRNFLLVCTLFVSSQLAFSQDGKTELEIFRSLFGMEKKALVGQLLQLEATKAEKFWPIYDQYEAERKLIGDRRIQNINDYVENYGAFTDEKLDELVKKSIATNKSLDKIQKKYYKKVKKAAGSKAAAQFFQLEGYFRNATRMLLFENLPLVGEMDLING